MFVLMGLDEGDKRKLALLTVTSLSTDFII